MANLNASEAEMRRVDGYLSQRAQRQWPGAIVYEDDNGTWILERPGVETVSLGDVFSRAHQAMLAILRAEKREEGE
jgi:hypothetical protein